MELSLRARTFTAEWANLTVALTTEKVANLRVIYDALYLRERKMEKCNSASEGYDRTDYFFRETF